MLNQRKNVCVPEGCDDESKENGLQGASRDQKSQQGIKISLRNTWKVIPPREPLLLKAATQFG